MIDSDTGAAAQPSRLWVARRPGWLLAVTLLYMASFVWLAPRVGGGMAALVVVPVATAGWFYGLKGGLIAGILAYPLNLLLFNLRLEGGLDAVTRAGGNPGQLAILAIGLMVGYTRQLRWQLQAHLQAERLASARLQQRQAQLDVVAKQIPAVLWATDRELRLVSLSGKAVEALGLELDKVVGQNLLDLLPDETTRELARQAHELALQGQGNAGIRRWQDSLFEAYLEPMRDDAGQIVGVAGIALDVTGREQAVQALESSEQRYRELFENATDIIYTFDLEGRITSLNRAAETVTGYQRSQVIGLDILQIVAPEHRERVSQLVLRKLQEGATTTYEVDIIAADGRHIPLEVRSRPLMERGRAVGVQGIARDISERRRKEKAAQERERLLQEHNRVLVTTAKSKALAEGELEKAWQEISRAAAETLGVEEVGVWLFSPDHSRIRCATAYNRSTGSYSAGTEFTAAQYPRYIQAVEEDRAIVAHDALADPRTAEFAEALRAKGTRSLLDVPIRVEGKAVGVLSHGHVGALRQWSLVEQHFAASMADLAAMAYEGHERRRVEAMLRQAQKQESLDILAGGVAHDFNNLLVAIMGQASLALAKVPAASQARDHIEKAVVATRTAANLTGQLLAYTGRGAFERRPLDVNQLIRDSLPLFSASVPPHVAIRADLDGQPATIQGDKEQIRQALLNLVLNGAEAIEEAQGRITITSGRRQLAADRAAQPFVATREASLPAGEYVVISLEDDGAGMDEETVGRIFDPFFTTKTMGRGLGLAAVLGIVDSHGGAIAVRSKLGAGSRFDLYFPAAQAGQLPAGPRPITAGREPGLTTVLLIDDEEPVRLAVSDILEMEQVETVLAENGEEGVALFQQHQAEIGLVILDLSMPGISGYETLLRLRQIDPQVKVLISSGYSTSVASRQFATEKPTAYLEKPYDAGTLVAVVRQHLS